MKKLIVIVLVGCFFILLSLPALAVYLPNDGYGMPSVTAPNMLFSSNFTDMSGNSDYLGMWFQSERGAQLTEVYQPMNNWYPDNNNAVMNTSIPTYLNTKSTMLANGWYDYGIDRLANFNNFSDPIFVNNRQYYSIGFALSFQDFPVYADYVNFEILLYNDNMYWLGASDTDPAATGDLQQLRFDSGDSQLMGLGYYVGNYFNMISQNTVTRVGDKWLLLQMKVAAGQLPSVTALQLTLNGTVSDDRNTSTVEKGGHLFLDFHFSSLISYPDTYGGETPEYAYSTIYGIFDKGDNIPPYVFPDEIDQMEQDALEDFDGISINVNDLIDSIDHNSFTFWRNVYESIFSCVIFTPLVIFATGIITIRALLGR